MLLLSLVALLIGHVLADYPLQGDFLARAKDRTNPIPGVPWYQALGAHCLIHAGFVWVITGVWWIGALEFVAHWITDYLKCHKVLSFNQDQLIHAACKVAWVVIWAETVRT